MSNWKKYQKEETNELIKLFQNSKTLESVRDDVYLALVFRFRAPLSKICEMQCKRKGYGIDTAYTITQSTFKKYYEYKSFKNALNKQSSVDDGFIAYLSVISRNLLNDHYKLEQKKLKDQFYDGTEDIVTDLTGVDVSLLSREEKIIHETLMSLPYAQRVVYLTYHSHEKNGVNLPQPLLKKLRIHLGGVSQPTIRWHKKKAIDKIEDTKRIIQALTNDHG